MSSRWQALLQTSDQTNWAEPKLRTEALICPTPFSGIRLRARSGDQRKYGCVACLYPPRSRPYHIGL